MLELEGVNTYYGKAHILHDLTLKVAEGEAVALLGRNGAGKTTTLKTIMQIVRPATGSIRFLGAELTRRAPYTAARLGLGYVPEDRRIFAGLTVVENLEVGRRPPRNGRARWTVEAVFALFPNLAERRHHLGRQLSGGEQQMLTIARTLMGNPLLLLLDEPSEGLAPVIVDQLTSTLLRLKRDGLTLLLSEQNLYFAGAVADRAAIIERGTLKFDGPFAELEASPAVRDQYLAV